MLESPSFMFVSLAAWMDGLLSLHIVNECLQDNGGCEQLCTDTRRSFTCSCANGYSLDSDGRGCTGKPLMLVIC